MIYLIVWVSVLIGALVYSEMRRFEDAKKIADLTVQLSRERENAAICGIALSGLRIWRDQQLKGKYDRAKDEAEALNAAAKHHDDALREFRENIIAERQAIATQFAAAIRARMYSGDSWQDALAAAENAFNPAVEAR